MIDFRCTILDFINLLILILKANIYENQNKENSQNSIYYG